MLKTSKTKNRGLIVWVVAIGSAFFIALNIGNWLFLRSMERYLDDELGRRLLSVGTLTAGNIDGNRLETILPGEENRPDVILLQQRLFDIRTSHGLENLYVINPLRQVLADARNFQIGEERIYLMEDSAEIVRAADLPVASRLHRIANHPFKSVYVPVRNDFGRTAGILVVEANADFFDLIDRFHKTLVSSALLSFGLVAFFSVGWFVLINRLFRLQDTLQKQERLAQMGQMAAGIAHEIRNPLGIIGGTAEVLKQKYSGKTGDELFTFIPGEVKRLSRLVNDFLAFAREKELNLKPVDLNGVLTALVDGLQTETGDRKVSFQLKLQENLPTLQADPDALKQVFLNILSNGIQAIEREGTIGIRTRLDHHAVTVTVSDSGSGIEPENLKKIFDPFFTTKSSGSGLGLAITKQLVEKHDGKISVTSQPGKGTEFQIDLPLP